MEDYAGLIWVLCGLIPYIIAVIIQTRAMKKEGIDYHFGSDPVAGQAFFIAVMLGPVFALLLASILLDTKDLDSED